MTIARVPYDELPVTLTAELAAGGLDPERVHAMVADAFDEDLPDGGTDVTSAAVPSLGVGRRRLRGPGGRRGRRASPSPSSPSSTRWARTSR